MVRLGNCMHVHILVFILIDEVRLGRRMHAGRVFPAVGLWVHTNCMHSCIVDVDVPSGSSSLTLCTSLQKALPHACGRRWRA